MKLAHIHFILSVGTLATSLSLKTDAELTIRAGEKILEGVDLVGHWAGNEEIKEPVEENIQIKAKDGKLYPLIELDCSNSDSGTRAYKGNYKQVCTNFCFNRHCDPSTKEQAKSPSLPGYQIYTRSKTGTNAVRRVSGGYSAGNNGPCSKANKGKDINFFHDEKNMVSLEEFPMAFMLEGGLHDIGGSKIGQTSLLVDVKRSVTFRCIPHKENISAGSKIFNMVKPRVKENEQFFLDIYNYKGIEYCNPKTTCENDGHQFVGLRTFDEQDLKTPGVAQPIVRPGSGSGRPGTPPNQMLPEKPKTPTAPSKKLPMNQIQKWVEDSRAIIYKGAPAPKTDATDDDETAIYPLPAGGQEALESKFQITRWQYFPFTGKKVGSTGISIGNGLQGKGAKDLKPFIDVATEKADEEALAAQMANLNVDCDPTTPSKNARGLDERAKGNKANKAASACSRKVPISTKSQKSPAMTKTSKAGATKTSKRITPKKTPKPKKIKTPKPKKSKKISRNGGNY